ncbi:MAG: hypothetical protein COT74_03395 [Bdellovibrionales bacterium CG10_big_fil_rev_8_21_14_0_10_45_34]|nr:MAG: hypothetical protein COT74_03395 [Bdellovibrionales bacterium CG10_big_fil_rev_8_21_14_0_10_45_34]
MYLTLAGQFLSYTLVFKKNRQSLFALRLLILGLAIYPLPTKTWAGASFPVPSLNTRSVLENQAPATDLLRDGRLIDVDQAIEDLRRGIDLSVYDPAASDVWGNDLTGFTEDPLPAEDSTVEFSSELSSVRESYRMNAVWTNENGERLNRNVFFSTKAHEALMRGALLKKIGYNVPPLVRRRNMTVIFKTLPQACGFLDDLSSRTLTSRLRWLAKEQQTTNVLTSEGTSLQGRVAEVCEKLEARAKEIRLSGKPMTRDKLYRSHEGDLSLKVISVLVAPARVVLPQFQWGVFSREAIRGRRALRAIIIPFHMTAVGEHINYFPWEFGKIFNQSILIDYEYGDRFEESTFYDALWAARKIANLSRSDFEEIAAAGDYPKEVSQLVAEKLIARREQMLELFDIKKEYAKIGHNRRLNMGSVVDGKLTQEYFEGYAVRFRTEDPDSPIKVSDIFRFLKIEGIGVGLNRLWKLVNENLPNGSISDIAQKRQDEILNDVIAHINTHGPNVPYERQVGVWHGPTFAPNFTASRNVVSGTYYGVDSKIQLVDAISVAMSAGYFVGIDGIDNVFPGLSAHVSVVRSYIHIRPLPNMKAADEYPWKNLWVPAFMGGKAKKLIEAEEHASSDPDIVRLKPQMNEGSISNAANSSESSPAVPDANNDELVESLNEFSKDINEGEMFLVIDSLVFGGAAQVSIPIVKLLGGPVGVNSSLNVSVAKNFLITDRLMLQKVSDGFQLYSQKMKTSTQSFAVSFSYWMSMFRYSQTHQTGDISTKLYDITWDEKDPVSALRAAQSLRKVLKDGSRKLVEVNYAPLLLDHEIDAKIKRTSFFFRKWDRLEEDHQVELTPRKESSWPDGANPEDYKRQLMSYRIVNRRGNNFYSGIADVLDGFSNGLGPSGAGGDGNPANSFLGSGEWKSITTELELTKARDSKQVTVVDHFFGGWSISRDGLFKILERIEKRLGRFTRGNPIVNRDEFGDTPKLQFYEIRSTLIIYPQGYEGLFKKLGFETSERTLVESLIDLAGREQHEQNCQFFYRSLENTMVLKYFGEEQTYPCVQPWMKSLLDFRKKRYSLSPAEKAKWMTRLFEKLERYVGFESLLGLIGEDNFFFIARVNGFRTQDERGDEMTVSNTIGRYRPEIGSGIFNEFLSKGVSDYELRARYFVEGF